MYPYLCTHFSFTSMQYDEKYFNLLCTKKIKIEVDNGIVSKQLVSLNISIKENVLRTL